MIRPVRHKSKTENCLHLSTGGTLTFEKFIRLPVLASSFVLFHFEMTILRPIHKYLQILAILRQRTSPSCAVSLLQAIMTFQIS